MKMFLTEEMLDAILAGAEGIRCANESLRRELAAPGKEDLAERLEKQIQQSEQQADLLSGFVIRVNNLKKANN